MTAATKALPAGDDRTSEGVYQLVDFVRSLLKKMVEEGIKRRHDTSAPYDITADAGVRAACRRLAAAAVRLGVPEAGRGAISIARGDGVELELAEDMWTQYYTLKESTLQALDEIEFAASRATHSSGSDCIEVSTEVPESTGGEWSARLAVDDKQAIVTLDGEAFSVTPDSATILAALLEAYPGHIAAGEYSSKPGRVAAKWPEKIQAVVHRSNKGYRLKDFSECPDTRGPDAETKVV